MLLLLCCEYISTTIAIATTANTCLHSQILVIFRGNRFRNLIRLTNALLALTFNSYCVNFLDAENSIINFVVVNSDSETVAAYAYADAVVGTISQHNNNIYGNKNIKNR